MSQRQRNKHQTDRANKGPKTVEILESVAGLEHLSVPTVDLRWMQNKQRPTTFSNKNRPAGPKPTWKKTAIETLVDEKVIKVLETTEEGRAFLKENPDGLVGELGL